MRGRIDANHREVVQALRDIGASVQSLADLGSGVPDLLVGFRGENYVFEVKDGSLPPSKRKLTPDEREWHEAWRGRVSTVFSPEDALKAILCK